jgi:hypothetical protein
MARPDETIWIVLISVSAGRAARARIVSLCGCRERKVDNLSKRMKRRQSVFSQVGFFSGGRTLPFETVSGIVLAVVCAYVSLPLTLVAPISGIVHLAVGWLADTSVSSWLAGRLFCASARTVFSAKAWIAAIAWAAFASMGEKKIL